MIALALLISADALPAITNRHCGDVCAFIATNASKLIDKVPSPDPRIRRDMLDGVKPYIDCTANFMKKPGFTSVDDAKAIDAVFEGAYVACASYRTPANEALRKSLSYLNGKLSDEELSRLVEAMRAGLVMIVVEGAFKKADQETAFKSYLGSFDPPASAQDGPAHAQH